MANTNKCFYFILWHQNTIPELVQKDLIFMGAEKSRYYIIFIYILFFISIF